MKKQISTTFPKYRSKIAIVVIPFFFFLIPSSNNSAIIFIMVEEHNLPTITTKDDNFGANTKKNVNVNNNDNHIHNDIYATPKELLTSQHFIFSAIGSIVCGFGFNFLIGYLLVYQRHYVPLWKFLEDYKVPVSLDPLITVTIKPYGTPGILDFFFTILYGTFFSVLIGTYLIRPFDIKRGRVKLIQQTVIEKMKLQYLGVCVKNVFLRSLALLLSVLIMTMPLIIIILTITCESGGMDMTQDPNNLGGPKNQCVFQLFDFCIAKAIIGTFGNIILAPLLEFASLNKDNLSEELVEKNKQSIIERRKKKNNNNEEKAEMV